MYFGEPPASFKAFTIFRDCSTGTASSLSPWKTQIGIFAMVSASSGTPAPQMGMAAANKSGFRHNASHVP